MLWLLGRFLSGFWTNFGSQKVRWDLLLFSPWSKEAARGRLGTFSWPVWYHLVAILGHFRVILGAKQQQYSSNTAAIQQQTSSKPAAIQQQTSSKPAASQKQTGSDTAATQQQHSSNPAAHQQQTSGKPAAIQQPTNSRPSANQQQASSKQAATEQQPSSEPEKREGETSFSQELPDKNLPTPRNIPPIHTRNIPDTYPHLVPGKEPTPHRNSVSLDL